MSDVDWTTAVAVATFFSIILGALGYTWRQWVKPFLRRIGQFLDDWNGEEQRPGFAGRPGVPARLAAIEVEQIRVRKEVEHNGGGSLKDAVKRLEEARKLDREAIDTIAHLVGAFVGREQVARLEGHRAQAELFATMRDIHDSGEGDADDAHRPR